MKCYQAVFVCLIGMLFNRAYAQDYGDSLQYYIGTHIQLNDPNSIAFMFLRDYKMPTRMRDMLYMKNNRPDGELVSKRQFKVEDVVFNTTTDIKLYSRFLKVKDLTDNTISYLIYTPGFPFKVVANEQIPYSDFVCKSIMLEKDKFDDRIKLSFPFNTPGDIYMDQLPNGTKKIYMYLTTTGKTAVAIEQGAILLFDDGTRLNFPNAKVSADVIKRTSDFIDPFKYTSLVVLSTEDLKVLSSKKLTDFRLYIFDKKLDEQQSDIIQCEAKCLAKAL